MNVLYVDRPEASCTIQTLVLIFLSQRNVHLEHMAGFIEDKVTKNISLTQSRTTYEKC